MAHLSTQVGAAEAERLAAFITGRAVAAGEIDTEALRRAADWHGVLPLLGHVLSREPAVPALHPLLMQAQEAVRTAQVTELLRHRDLRRVLASLDAAGVHPLLMKGAALGYTHYERPELRPRLDTDLFLSREHQSTARAALEALGCRAAAQTSGQLVSQQFHVVSTDEYGVEHVYDLHWSAANPVAFARVLTFEEADAEAVPVPACGPLARTLSPVHALLVACVHRVAHHDDRQRLIWLVDIHRLRAGLGVAEWGRFARLARERKVAAVCARGLTLAEHYLGGGSLVGRLDDLRPTEREPSAAYLRTGHRKIDTLGSDLRLLTTWRDRVRLVREHLLPPRAFMHTRYGAFPWFLAPWFYVRRAIGGVRDWLRPRVGTW